MKVSENLLQSYAGQYDESAVGWRMMAAKHKAKNIVKLAGTFNFETVLEVGCGEGSILHWLSEWNFCSNLYGIDISASGLEIARGKCIKNVKEILQYDGYHIPYNDNHFDLIVCSHVIEHVEHQRALLREIKRVSKYQVFEVPIDFSFYVDKKIDHFLSYGHINIYTPSLFRFLLKSEKFEVIQDINSLYDDEIMRYSYSNNANGYRKQKLKNFILKSFPYLLGIKPNSYAVLTKKQNEEISIM